MNQLDLDFIELAKKRHPLYFTKRDVLELGAQDVNGNVRGPFEDCRFVGVDWIEGKNVDVVAKGSEMKLPKRDYTVLLSANHLEHDPEWEATLRAGLAAMKDGSLILLRWASRQSAAHGPEFDPHGKLGYYAKDIPEVQDFLIAEGIAIDLTYYDQNPCIGRMANLIACKGNLEL